MIRTPILVPGKKGNKTKNLSRNMETSRGSRLSTPTPSRSTSESSRTASRLSQRDAPLENLKITKDGRHLSNFEKLPNELLHRIFLYARNLDLPDVSPHLATALNGVGAKYLRLEYSMRSLYKPFSLLHDQWYQNEDRIFENPDILELLSQPDPARAEGGEEVPEGEARPKVNYRSAKYYLLRKLGIVRWKSYRERGLQHRLLRARFFNWDFLQTLIRKAHPRFQQEITQVHNALGLAEFGMERTQQWWTCIDTEVLLADIQALPKAESSFLELRQDHRLPWLQLVLGVAIPSKLTRGPWLHGDGRLLYWLVQGNAGMPELGTELYNSFRMQPLPSRMLADAVVFEEDWIAFICTVRARTIPTTEMLRHTVTVEPFPFIMVRNLLWQPRDDDVGGSNDIPHTTIDTLDPQIWSFIERQELLESHKAESLTTDAKVKDCISPAKWLKRSLRLADHPPERGSFAPYFPLMPPLESMLMELSGASTGEVQLRDVPVHSRVWEILITPEQVAS